MKKVLIALALIFGLVFFVQENVYAADGPLIIHAVVEDGSAPEITVQLVKEDYEKVKEYKLNKKNNWYIKDNVPLGKYKILSYAEDLPVISQSLLQFEKRTVEVISNPVKTDNKDETPKLNTIYGGKDYMRSFKGMVAYVREDGSMLHGVVSYDEMKAYLEEAAIRQTGDSRLRVSPIQSPKEETDKKVSEKKSEAKNEAETNPSFKAEEPKEKKVPTNQEEFKPADTNQNKKNSKWIVLIGVISFVGIIVIIYYIRKNRGE